MREIPSSPILFFMTRVAESVLTYITEFTTRSPSVALFTVKDLAERVAATVEEVRGAIETLRRPGEGGERALVCTSPSGDGEVILVSAVAGRALASN